MMWPHLQGFIYVLPADNKLVQKGLERPVAEVALKTTKSEEGLQILLSTGEKAQADSAAGDCSAKRAAA